jgi:hypothetical protein
VLEAIAIIVQQKDRTVPVFMKQLALSQDDAAYVYDSLHRGWALDGEPTLAAMKLDAELSMRDIGLKEMPKPEQSYDLSLLDEIGKK